MALQPRMPPPEELPSRQVPVRLAPCRAPPAGGLELLACRAPRDAWHTVPIWPPRKLEAQRRAVPSHAGVEPAEPPQGGRLWCTLEAEFLSPLGEHAGAPFGVVLLPKGADPVVGVTAQ